MFATPEDIVNRGLQHIGVPRIAAAALGTEQTRQAIEANFLYHKLRRAELTRSVWGFAVRRAVMRKYATTTRAITPAAYSAATTYGLGDIVTSANMYWQSQIAANLANTPGLAGIVPKWSLYCGPLWAQAWVTATPYYEGDLIYTSSTAYVCILAHSSQSQPNATYWLPLTATIAAPTFMQPINYPYGYPTSPTAARNIYRYPANFLRMAPLDAKDAGTSRQNVGAGMGFNDIEMEDPYFLSAVQGSTSRADPFFLRFVADISDVATMTDMFCETLAARIATELAEVLTQNDGKMKMAVGLYDAQIAMAKFINAVEAGSTENEPNQPVGPGVAGGGQQQRGG